MPRLPHRQLSMLLASIAIAPSIAPAQARDKLRVEKVASFPAIGGEFSHVTFNGDGTSMVSAGSRGDLIWWDMRGLTLRRRYPAPAHYVYRMVHHPTRELVAFGSSRDDRASLMLLDLPSGRLRKLMPQRVLGLAFDAAGEQMAVAYDNQDDKKRYVRIFAQLQDWTPQEKGLPPHRDIRLPSGTRLLWPCFTATGKILYLSDYSISMAGNPRHLEHLAIDLTSVRPKPRRGAGAVLGRDGDRGLVRMLESRHLLVHGKNVEVGDRHTHVATAAGHVARMPWNVKEYFARLSQEHEWQRVDVPDCSFLRFINVAADGTIVVGDARSQLHVYRGKERNVLGGHRGRVVQLCFTPDSRYVASTGESAVRVADLAGRVVQDFLGGHGADRGLVGPELVIANRKGADLWNASLRRVVRRLASWPESFRPSFYLGLYSHLVPGPTAMATLPGSNKLLFRESETTRYGREVAFDLARGTFQKLHDKKHPNADFRRHAAYLVPSPTGKHFAVVEDVQPAFCGNIFMGMKNFGALRLHTADGELREYEALEHAPRTVCFSPDGNRLFVGGPDNSVQLLATEGFTAASEKRKLATKLLWTAFLDDKTLLAHDVTQLIVLSLPALTVRQQIKLPGLGNLTESMPLWAPPDADNQQIEALALSPDKTYLAVGCSSTVFLYRLAWTTD